MSGIKQEYRIWVPVLGCGVLDRGKKSNSKQGHNSEKENAFWIVSLDSMDGSLDNVHILWVSYLQ